MNFSLDRNTFSAILIFMKCVNSAGYRQGPDQPERQDERFDAIGIDERRRERGEAEQSPGARGCETRSGLGLGKSLEPERPDQKETEDETAVHVRPRSHQHNEDEGWRAAAIARVEQPGAPRGCDR